MKYLIGFALFMTALLFTLLVSGYAVDRFNITFAAEKTEPKIPVQSNEEFCIDYIQPRDPESPWYRDPDISAIKDERIVQLWEDIMILVSTEFSLILSVDYLPLFYTTRLPESPIPG